MPFSTAIDNFILDHFTGKAVWSAPAATWIGLSSTTPGKDGTNVTEPATGGYARIQITGAQWTTAASSHTENNADKSFAVASGTWLAGVNLTHLVIYDQAAAGNMIAFKALTVPKPVMNGDIAKILNGELDITIGGT
jgi:hypothetical protein